jgi:hypothetical protein
MLKAKSAQESFHAGSRARDNPGSASTMTSAAGTLDSTPSYFPFENCRIYP